MRPVSRAALALAGAAAAGVAYGGLVERRWYALRHVTVPVLRPAAARPLRVLHLSDLHFVPQRDGGPRAEGRRDGEWRADRWALRRFLHRCLAEGPDLVVGTGDFLGDEGAVDPVVALLGEVAAGRPAVAVLGSNDIYAPVPKNPLHYLTRPERRVHGRRLETQRLVAGLRQAGWVVLDNHRTVLETPAGPLDVIGIGDAHLHRDRLDTVNWTAPGEPVALRLGVTHAPYQRVLAAFDEHDLDLVLAGHTHGGQLRLPGVGALVTNCDLPTRQARGLSRTRGGRWLHVSAGLGTSRYAPVRFACRPEATLVDLVAGRL